MWLGGWYYNQALTVPNQLCPKGCVIAVQKGILFKVRIVLHRPWLGEEGTSIMPLKQGVSLLEAIWLSGEADPLPLCTGLGRCGNCRVRFMSHAPAACAEDLERLGEEAVALGWRLACHCRLPVDAAGDVHLELPKPAVAGHTSCRIHAAANTNGHEPCVMAADLGTTSIAWRLIQEKDGKIMAEGEMLNPQAGAGADVVSRIARALEPEGTAVLAGMVRSAFAEILAVVPGKNVSCMAVAANSAMTEIFAGRDVHGLAASPYSLSMQGNEIAEIAGLPPVYIPPLLGPFVGGDVTAGLLWLERQKTERPYVLADLGTNGEIALMTEQGRLYVSSVPLGPALEGIGLECGALAGPDVLTKFVLGPQGLAGYTGDGFPLSGRNVAGISATGYLSLLEQLVLCGILDKYGHFRDNGNNLMPFAKKLKERIVTVHNIPRFLITEDTWMSLRDVEEILKVKAAFSVALASLLQKAGLASSDLCSLNIAGALGSHLQARTLERLGFVPAGMAGRVRSIGNSSLEGAAILALDQASRDEIAKLCQGACLLEPAREQSFQEQYISAMCLGQ